jgi:hypothetical protein
MRVVLGLALGACLFGSNAAAQTAPPVAPPAGPPPGRAPADSAPASPAPPAPARVRFLSVTATLLTLSGEIMGLHHHLSVVPSLAVELRAHPWVGIQVMGLVGDDTYTPTEFTIHNTFFEVGAEPRFYVLGGFQGLMLGAALHYFFLHREATAHAGTPDAYTDSYDYGGHSYGPFAGYKYTSRAGFTFEMKVGFSHVKRTLSDGGPYKTTVPLMDAKVGWSF